MKRQKANPTIASDLVLRLLLALITFSSVVAAQQPSPSPAASPTKQTHSSTTTNGSSEGDYTIVSSIEVGYRGLKVVGDLNKYQSDLNYKAGPRLFDSSFLMKSTDGKAPIVDTLLVTTTGWGADQYGNVRFSAEKPEWYRFDGQFRRFKYFRFVNNLANPNWIFSPASFSVPPNPITGEHGYNAETKLGDFDLTILPKNNRIRFNVGYSPERYSGPAFTNYHIGGNEFNFLNNLRSQANDFRVGADAKVGPIDLSFLQGFRRFRDDSFVNLGPTPGINLNPSVARFTSFNRNEPTRSTVDFTRFSAHTFIAKKVDMTARIVYSIAKSNFNFIENFTGVNFNTRITGGFAPPNTLNLGQYNILGNTTRPNTLFDYGVTYFATDKLRISNTFRVETFQINGGDIYNSIFVLTRPSPPATQRLVSSNLSSYEATKYRKIQNTIEGDYQFNARYSVHFGYRYGNRRIEEIIAGYALNSNAPILQTPSDEVEHNHTNAFLGGFKARPTNNWTVNFDMEHGTADNIFFRIGNYNYTNIRAKSRYTPSKDLSFNVAVITKNNSNPSEIAGVSLNDFGVDIRSRIFTASVDWALNPRISFSTGYNYNWVNSDAVVDYFFNSIRHPNGHSLYYVRNNFFFFDTVAQLHPRVSLYTSYRINKDNGQGNRVTDPTGTPGFLISSYPINFQSPEGRITFKVNRLLDWNIGYQYYNYNESAIVGPRQQNYHAHLPYTSLRVYFGRRE